jgi:hypothetical protein
MKTNKTDILGVHLIPFAIFALMSLIAALSNGWEVSTGPGISVQEPPIQEKIIEADGFEHKGYNLMPLAEFDLKAKVISKKKYNDSWSDICPFDFTLGWGKLSDESLLNKIWFSQSSRRTYFQTENLPQGLAINEMISLSSNMHLCPADKVVARRMRDVPIGALIQLQGKLIRLSKVDGTWYNESSLTREDTGDGACEIIWVENFEIK